MIDSLASALQYIATYAAAAATEAENMQQDLQDLRTELVLALDELERVKELTDKHESFNNEMADTFMKYYTKGTI